MAEDGTYREDADRLYPSGCQCPENDNGGDCEWCQVYYHGVEG